MSKYLIVTDKIGTILFTIKECELVQWFETDESFFNDSAEIPYKQADDIGFYIKDNDYFRKLNFEQILLVEASGSYSFIHTSSNKYCVSFNLTEIATKLPTNTSFEHTALISLIFY